MFRKNQRRTLAFCGRVVYIYGKLRFLLCFTKSPSEKKRDNNEMALHCRRRRESGAATRAGG
ncbi:hypothetical protein KQQSB11_350067 [Klebsiella quasipneumoniae subsp. quasipneumoniae]|nr:hypothetical protein KQQSB11_350067 [Klebsiella quasipneumoniae subsp. quasipneumoniae]